MPSDGGTPEEVSARPLELFALSPDGRRLAYSYRDPDRQCVRVTVVATGAGSRPRDFDIDPIFALRWTPDGAGLAFTHEQGNVWIQPLEGGAAYPVTRRHPGFRAVTFAWSPDARYLAYTLLASPVDAIAFTLR
jgi:tricorn protease-like protein